MTGSQDFPLKFSFCRPGNLYGSQEPEMNLILAQLKTLPYTNFSLEGKISEAVISWHPLQALSLSEDPETGCLDPVPGNDCIKDQFHMVKKRGFLHLSPRTQNSWPVPPSSAGVKDSLGLCNPWAVHTSYWRRKGFWPARSFKLQLSDYLESSVVAAITPPNFLSAPSLIWSLG